MQTNNNKTKMVLLIVAWVLAAILIVFFGYKLLFGNDNSVAPAPQQTPQSENSSGTDATSANTSTNTANNTNTANTANTNSADASNTVDTNIIEDTTTEDTNVNPNIITSEVSEDEADEFIFEGGFTYEEEAVKKVKPKFTLNFAPGTIINGADLSVVEHEFWYSEKTDVRPATSMYRYWFTGKNAKGDEDDNILEFYVVQEYQDIAKVVSNLDIFERLDLNRTDMYSVTENIKVFKTRGVQTEYYRFFTLALPNGMHTICIIHDAAASYLTDAQLNQIYVSLAQ